MKYTELNKQVQDRLTIIFDDLGVFFAFSDKQFKEGAKDEKNIVSIGMGGFIPKKNVPEYIRRAGELEQWRKSEMQKQKAEQVIEYELANHEAYYTGDITDTFEALKDHYTLEQIREVYQKTYNKYD